MCSDRDGLEVSAASQDTAVVWREVKHQLQLEKRGKGLAKWQAAARLLDPVGVIGISVAGPRGRKLLALRTLI